MSDKNLETVQPPTTLPVEALNVLDQAEQQGLQFLADHPGLNVHIYLSLHENAEHLGTQRVFEEAVGKADVYALEGIGNTSEDQVILDVFSQRKLSSIDTATVLASEGSSYKRRAFWAIYKTGVKAVWADLPAGHRLSAKQPSLAQIISSLESEYDEHGEAAAQLPEVEALAETAAARIDDREWVMLAQLGSKLSELAASDPAIAEKIQADTLRVFMTYGAMHTGLFHKLRQIGLNPERSFPSKPFNYPSLLPVIRKQAFKKHKPANTVKI